MYTNQRTLKRKVEIKGIGLHSGELVSLNIEPMPANTGIIFEKNNVLIPAKVEFAKSFEFSTSIENKGEKVQTIEHLMAALYLLGIDNVKIKISGSEVPILDGSAKEFIDIFKIIGIKNLPEEKFYAVITEDINVKDKDKFIKATPSNEPIFTYEAVYDKKVIGNRKFSFKPFSQTYQAVSPARTYCFFEEIDFLKQMGLAKGGSLENAVVFKEDEILNPEGLRFEDEPVRHKLLDLIGDLYLLGYPIVGNVYSYKGGHFLNAAFVRKMIESNAYTLIPASELPAFARNDERIVKVA